MTTTKPAAKAKTTKAKAKPVTAKAPAPTPKPQSVERKIASIAFAEGVQVGFSRHVGKKSQTFLTAGKEYDITMEGSVMIRIDNLKSKETVYTTLFNTKWWTFA